MPKIAISPRAPWMRGRWISCWGIPLPTAWRSGYSEAARCIRCKPCPRTIRTNHSLTQWARRPGSHPVHAGVSTKAYERDKLERLCRYVARPAVSEKRLSMTAQARCVTSLRPPVVERPLTDVNLPLPGRLVDVLYWPVFPLAGLPTNRAVGCREGQVSTPNRTCRLVLNKLFLNSSRRPNIVTPSHSP